MVRLPPVLLAIACAACALPAAAGSAHIIVHGGKSPDQIPQPPTSYAWPDNDLSRRDILWDQYWTPSRLGGAFDAAQAAIDAEAIAHPRPSRTQLWNPDLAATIVRTGDSFAAHWLKCQRAYASYCLVTDTYDGPNGLPRPCRL